MYLQSQKEKEGELDTLLNKEALPERFVYRISPGDILSVKIESITPEKFGLEKNEGVAEADPLLSGYLVEDDGSIELPFIGKVIVVNLTLSEAQSQIKKEAADELINPSVKVKLLSYTYTILGEVNRPGTFRGYKGEITLFEALGNAEDMTDFADRTKVKMIRMHNDAMTVDYLNLLNREVVASEYFYLRPGDIVYVPPMKVKNFAKYQLPNMAWAISVLSVISLLLIRIN